ncbi:MAG: branched-chain amino acid ABC transporter permease [Sediminimonas qiaohouensis]|uniref:Branched-chain amino acid ABC transporter permease n=1 Tax=Sediminimonas qiaohouensis TaxID=552061 RepID=A0A7C9LKS3_9RHOB|nr:branched-chain amino acid ABC transporter permease [Sediminimonas qiaohouensis]MTJ04219.1 branched-chain amino acid ABC transporter permease [Sediminimonas qiaohouensis]
MNRHHVIADVSAPDRRLMAAGGLIALGLFALPLFGSALVVDKLTLLMVYIILAVMWNLLAGYAGLVSVGQQAFIGLGGYFVLRLVESGMPPFLAIGLGGFLVLLAAWPLSWLVLRLKPAEFAVAMWVLAETIRSIVMFDPLVQGETGRSLVSLNAIDPDVRRTTIYLMAVMAVVISLVLSHALLRGRLGGESQAIRDDEEAASSVGVSTLRVKRWIFLISAVGCAIAGTIWLASAITFQPRSAFGINWSIFMLFMVLVGGLGSYLGPVLGALLFFALQEVFGDFGAWYLAGIGVVAILFALFAPRGIMGLIIGKTGQEPLSMRKLLITREG